MRAKREPAYQIRKTIYRNREGYLICGGGHGMFGCRIFTETRESAERIRDKKRAGEEILLSDFGFRAGRDE